MTALIATATHQGVLISQDSAVGWVRLGGARHGYGAESMAGRDPNHVQQHFCGDGTPKDDGAIARRIGKIGLFRDQRFAVGACGAEAPHLALIAALRLATPSSLDEAVAAAPGMLRQAMKVLSLPVDHVTVFGGWSDQRQSFGLWAFAAADDFVAHRMLPGEGHCMSPVPWAGDGDYAKMRSRWNAAAAAGAPSEGTQRFHRAYCANLRRAFLSGWMRPGAVIGGPYHTACIDREGAWLERWTLPDDPVHLEAA